MPHGICHVMVSATYDGEWLSSSHTCLRVHTRVRVTQNRRYQILAPANLRHTQLQLRNPAVCAARLQGNVLGERACTLSGEPRSQVATNGISVAFLRSL